MARIQVGSRFDRLSPSERSERMRRVQAKNTKPEIVVRRLVSALGYRYRLHNRKLPGCPDLVFPCRKKVIFVHGCFWHQHQRCRQYQMPKTRLEFWLPKLKGNMKRDRTNRVKLKGLGWAPLIVWECQLKNPSRVSATIQMFLEDK